MVVDLRSDFEKECQPNPFANDKDIDGYWRVEDTMNKRFAGQKKIDFLVDYDRKLGKWNDLKIYKVVNPEDAENIKSKFLPPLPKQNKV